MFDQVTQYGEGLRPDQEQLRSTPQPLVDQVEAEGGKEQFLC